MAWLLDTSALLAHYRGELGAERVQSCFADEDQDVLIASVSLPELARRLRELGLTPEDAMAVVNRYVNAATRVVAIDAEVAWQSFRLICATPERLPLVDALITAAAVHSQATLVHRDPHMGAVPSALLRQMHLASAG